MLILDTSDTKKLDQGHQNPIIFLVLPIMLAIGSQ